ncbi:thermonuclease family protein [bacterium]|nr:thermonuclease family protein [bacterium]
MIHTRLLGLWLTVQLAVPAQPLLPARVLSVTDGDTVKLQTQQGIQKVRLDSIDAPEKRQPGGPESRQALRQLIPNGAQVHLLPLGQDRYGRILGQLYLPDGTNLNVRQVRDGQAWVFTRYCRAPEYWMPIQAEAQQRHRGLWAQSDPIPPWVFRHPKKN